MISSYLREHLLSILLACYIVGVIGVGIAATHTIITALLKSQSHLDATIFTVTVVIVSFGWPVVFVLLPFLWMQQRRSPRRRSVS
jgi:hypothetical protein